MAEEFVTEITKKSEDFSEWYVQIVRRAELADYSPLKGCMVIRPYGYTIWENIQAALDGRLKETGHVNAYFPLFIPESFLAREAEHVKGFAPQVAWVTQGGDEVLEERWAVRPTSEAIIGYMYSKWVRSWRDLPILINQWCNIVRWEKVTRLFLRTTEFLWQEGHTLHRTHEDALEEVLRILEIYRDLVENDLAISVITGKKSPSERFAGALDTYTLEALMPDGKALQCGTSHDLGQNFSRAFEITFLDSDGQEKHAWSTSWGVSTRLIGGLIMVHGDDSGLIIPPKIAPHQVVIVPIFYGEEQSAVVAKAHELKEMLKKSGIRVKVDDRDEYTPGWKFSEWELRGVPLRLEIGPRDLASSEAVLVRRDTREKIKTSWEALPKLTSDLLEALQHSLLERSRSYREGNTRESQDLAEFKNIIEEKRGFILSPWCGSEACEEEVKAQTTATIRCLKEEEPEGKSCLVCGKPAKYLAYFAKSY